MKPQPVMNTPTLYKASYSRFNKKTGDFGEATTLRGVVAQLHTQVGIDLEEVWIHPHIPGWDITPAVPFTIYMQERDTGWVLNPVESVAEHWYFPVPYMYFAVDFERKIWVESPTLTGIVEQLHRAGHSSVSSRDMRVWARFAREDSEVDDITGVPLDLLCVVYLPPAHYNLEDDTSDDYDDTIEDEDADDDNSEVDEESGAPRGCLPPMAELSSPEIMSQMPHYIFGAFAVQKRRINRLLGDDLILTGE